MRPGRERAGDGAVGVELHHLTEAPEVAGAADDPELPVGSDTVVGNVPSEMVVEMARAWPTSSCWAVETAARRTRT